MKRAASRDGETTSQPVAKKTASVDVESLEAMTKEELIQKIVDAAASSSQETARLREELQSAQKSESDAQFRLTMKEKLNRELSEQLEGMRKLMTDERKPDRMMMDPFVNGLFHAMQTTLREVYDPKLKKDMKSATASRESIEIARLTRKCARLEDENAEMKRELKRAARLDTALAFSRKSVDALLRRRRDVAELVAEYSEETKKAKQQVARLIKENARLRQSGGTASNNQEEKTDAGAAPPDSEANGFHESPLDHHQDETESDGFDACTVEEMVTVSSPESISDDEKDEPENRSVAQVDEVITVSSPEPDPENVVSVSSPEGDAIDDAGNGVPSDDDDDH